MSVLKPGDEHLHYSDNSHRWLSPEQGVDEDEWAAKVKAHMEDHGRSRDTPSRLVRRLQAPRNRR